MLTLESTWVIDYKIQDLLHIPSCVRSQKVVVLSRWLRVVVVLSRKCVRRKLLAQEIRTVGKLRLTLNSSKRYKRSKRFHVAEFGAA